MSWWRSTAPPGRRNMRALQDYSERMMRAAIRRLAARACIASKIVSTATASHPNPVWIRVTVTIRRRFRERGFFRLGRAGRRVR